MASTRASLLRKRMRAFLGATAVVVVLWLVAVVAVSAFVGSPPEGGPGARFVEGVPRLKLPPGALRHDKGALVLLHSTGGSPLNPTAWPTVVQILILIALAALVVAGLDGLRRQNRRRRRLRTA
jgi:hypothetical protein